MDLTLLMTDLHVAPPGVPVAGLDPWARLDLALSVALERHPDAGRLILLGDLSHRGEPETYARLADRLAALPVPVHPMLGNHDRRTGFARGFAGHTDEEGFAQTVVDLDTHRLILCDTLDEAAPDRHSGLICARRMEWLERALETAGGRRIVVLTHHHLFATGFPGMDRIALRNAAEVAELLRAHPVDLVVSGHVHSPISGMNGGLAWCVLPGTCHQMPMQLGDEKTTSSSHAPGGYGVLLTGAEGAVVHVASTERPTVIDEPGSA